MKNELVSVKQAMRANLSHLDDGGLITEIPHCFEVITVETNEPDYLNLESNSSKPASSTNDDNTDRQPVAEKPDQVPQVENTSPIETKIKDRKLSRDDNQLSFWGLLKAWLLSPWSTSWQNIKEKHNKKP
ncbi:hypothetical protein FLL45_12380 [Aliikangiella marina]|uniref:Uncharacterized protein n=1 Tax=Aliikangiella marina TaxID=1712262 RepID=A0A545T8W0_9GAMM|nr:hypothetical protein [Aliikangiella marina]TQV73663.1 hypothetical protein FLL45_12380 [Aliikangiella marina]